LVWGQDRVEFTSNLIQSTAVTSSPLSIREYEPFHHILLPIVLIIPVSSEYD